MHGGVKKGEEIVACSAGYVTGALNCNLFLKQCIMVMLKAVCGVGWVLILTDFINK